MSLFGSLQLGANSLRAMQIGLHVVGNNIANANTPGFVREEVVYSPAPTQKLGRLTLGMGVEIDGIVQKVDRFLAERLSGAASDRAGAEVQSKTYNDLETLLGELSNNDLSTSLTSFFNSIDDVAQADADLSVRNLAISRGETLAAEIRRLASRTGDLKGELDNRIDRVSGDINTLTEEIRVLNLRIAATEGGSASASEAGGLRSERAIALRELAELADITTAEQPNGTVNVSVGGQFLIFEGQRRAVEIALETTDSGDLRTIRYVDNAAELNISGGELHGLYAGRDEIVGRFIEDLDRLAGTLAFEFNKLYSQGQGLVGFESLVSQDSVSDAAAPLDAAGLAFTPENGSFELLVRNKESGAVSTTVISVDLNGLDGDTTLSTLAEAIDGVDGVSATIDLNNRLSIASESEDIDFAFANDAGGTLAALGLNTFFVGSDARTLGVNSELDGVENAAKFAASLGGVGAASDNANALRLAAFFDRSLESTGGASLADQYDQVINEVTTGATLAQSVAEGFSLFEATLEGEEQAISGVSIDEEAIDMITLQRSYQASARYIQAISELLDVLVNL